MHQSSGDQILLQLRRDAGADPEHDPNQQLSVRWRQQPRYGCSVLLSQPERQRPDAAGRAEHA